MRIKSGLQFGQLRVFLFQLKVICFFDVLVQFGTDFIDVLCDLRQPVLFEIRGKAIIKIVIGNHA